MVTEEYFKELKSKMAKNSVDNKGWGVSAIYDGVEISFAKKIALNADKNKNFFA